MIYSPAEDGKSHINIYSHGATALGQNLSNFAPISVTIGGLEFASVEAYWFWLGCAGLSEAQETQLRSLSGLNARQTGRRLRAGWPGARRPDFEQRVRLAIRRKIMTHPQLALELARSDLPLTHYYVRNGVAVDAGFSWVTRINSELRDELRPLRRTGIQVVNVSRDSGQCVYVGRAFAGRKGSALSNPFPVLGKGAWTERARQACLSLIQAGKMESEARQVIRQQGAAHGEAVALYRAWLKLKLSERGNEFDEMRDLARRVIAGEQIRLGCWCAPNPCHADVVAQAVEGMVFSIRLRTLARREASLTQNM